MPWDNERFQNLKEQVARSLQGKPSPLGIPFYLYTYSPEDETVCIREFQGLERFFRNEGFHVQIIYLGQVLSHVLKQTPYLSPIGVEIEKQSRDKLEKELTRYLPEKVSKALLLGIPGLFEPLKGGEQSKGVFLLRAGALFPFVHVSQILAYLEGQTRWTVVVAFPGSRSPSHPERLRFLNETEGMYYRAMIF